MAHARKKKFDFSRVGKKIVVPKFGDVFIGSTNKNSSKKAPEMLYISTTPSFTAQESLPEISKEDLKKKFQFNEKDLNEPRLATYLDVAVLRCLFTSQWIEEGINWGLNFIYRRLETISKLKEKKAELSFRSSSLPIPKRKVEVNLLEKLEPKSCRPKTDFNNENNLDTRTNSQLKTSFNELRRSSFSGLPGWLLLERKLNYILVSMKENFDDSLSYRVIGISSIDKQHFKCLIWQTWKRKSET